MASVNIPQHSPMNDTSLPSNSKLAKKNVESIVEKKTEKVATGQIVEKKEGFVKSFRKKIFSGESNTVGGYILNELLIPNIKDFLSSAVQSTLDMMLYGDNTFYRRNYSLYRRPGGYNRPATSRVTYSRPESQTRYYQENPNLKMGSGQSVTEANDIFFQTREEAVCVLKTLQDLLSEYDQVTVADLYDAAGITTTFTQNKYGWYNIENARIRPSQGGYVLLMPKTKYLD